MQQNTAQLYNQYKQITEKAADFNYAAAVLSWDQEVYMPPKGFEWRGRQLSTLAGAAHELLTGPSYGALLQELAGRGDLEEDQRDNVRLSLEDYEKNRKLPQSFIEELTQQTSKSYGAWIEAREKNDYTIYQPELEKMLELKRQQAEHYGYAAHPYDALLDDYEKGATVAMLDPIFSMVGDQLRPLLEKVRVARQVDDCFFHAHFPKKQQFDFSIEVLRCMGYDLEAGRQDYSEHPFSISFAPTDVRVTTRVKEDNLSSLLWSSIHEGGHALYEQGLPEDQYGLPLGAAASLSIHESQSRLWENCVGRSWSFWRFFYPKLQQHFPEQLAGVAVREFYRAANKVSPSLIRTEADELTYHFHVMIRYELEKMLIGGTLECKDLAAVWNEYYKKYLGVAAEDDRSGVLQDVHWSHGSFGYFPTYSLGSFYAAQFFEQAAGELDDFSEQVMSGDFQPLLAWLRNKVHRHGRRYRSEELCEKVTGKRLDFGAFMRYATQKYSDIYNLSELQHGAGAGQIS